MPEKCALCDGEGPFVLHSRCHLTAPLMATLDGDTLILQCYVPECRREVARMKIKEILPAALDTEAGGG